MYSLGQVSFLDEVEAKIQAKVGELLGARQKLIEYTRSPSLSIQAKAKGLMTTQRKLEEDLKPNLAKIDQFKEGAYSFGDVLELADYGRQVWSHLGRVDSLKKEAQGLITAGGDIDWKTWAPIVGSILGGAILIPFMLKK